MARAVDAAFFALKAAKVRVKVDDRAYLRPGPKFFEWERKGVPLRIEVGPRDVANGQGVMKPRVDLVDGVGVDGGGEGGGSGGKGGGGGGGGGAGAGKVPVPLDPALLVPAVQAALDQARAWCMLIFFPLCDVC